MNMSKKEEIIFDANRDNAGKGIPSADILRLLEKISKEETDKK